jgi:RHS repeat-associated protein
VLIRKDREYSLYDGLGSSRTVTDASQSVIRTLTYNAFGQLSASSGSSTTNYMIGATSGYESNGDTGIILVGARYYDPQVGRFLTRDSELDQKPYLYCEHDPINHLDPSGHDDLDDLGPVARSIADPGYRYTLPFPGGGQTPTPAPSLPPWWPTIGKGVITVPIGSGDITIPYKPGFPPKPGPPGGDIYFRGRGWDGSIGFHPGDPYPLKGTVHF